METKNTPRIFCNTCKTVTRHEQVADHHRVLFESDYFGEAQPELELTEWRYSFLTCRGCDTSTLREEYFSHMEDARDVSEVTYYPEREKSVLPIKIYRELDPKLKRIYQEVITAFNHEAPTLAAIGLRALLEGICAEKGIKGGNLVVKINGLKDFLPDNIVESLHKFRFIGNEAAHELQSPEVDELRLAIEVMEDLLNFMYELDYKARNFFEGVSPTGAGSRPNAALIQRMIERQPVPVGQIQLYKALFAAGNSGIEVNKMPEKLGRRSDEIAGILGALGKRINNTPGILDKPGISYVFNLINFDTGGWGWAMKDELRQAIRTGNYTWAKDWAK